MKESTNAELEMEASVSNVGKIIKRLESQISEEEPSLFAAAQRGKFDVAKNFIASGVDVNVSDSELNLAVDYAWRNQFYDIVLLLLKADSCFPKDFDLHQLIDKNEGKILKDFVIDQNLLHKYIKGDDLKNVKRVVSKRKSKFYLNQRNQSATFTALKCKRFNIQAYLKSIGAEFLNDQEKKEVIHLELKDKFALREANVIHFHQVSGGHIDYLISKSRTQKRVEGSRDKLKNYYFKLDKIPEVSIIFKVVQYSDYLDVVFDFDEENVAEVNPLSSKNTKGEAMYKEGRLYIAAGVKRGENKILGTIAHEITHMAMQLLFENDCNPYSAIDRDGKENFEKIKMELFSNVKNGIKDYPSQVLLNIQKEYNKRDYDSELIVTVPQILAECEDGTKWLQENACELFNFYNQTIIPKCHEFIMESPMFKAKNKIRKFNESLGEIMKLRKFNLNFKNVDSVRNFLREDKKLFIFKTEHTHLGVVKVLQGLFGPNYINEYDKYLALNFENLMFELNDVIQAFLNGCEKLILEFNRSFRRRKIIELFEMIWEIFDVTPNKKIIFIIHPNMEENLRKIIREFQFTGACADKTDDPLSLSSFDKKSERMILSRWIIFQGMKMSLNDLIATNEHFSEFITTDVIEDLIKGKSIQIGSKITEHHNLERAFGFVYEKINMKNFIRQLKYSKDVFVIYGLNKKDEFVACFHEYITKGLIDPGLIVRQLQIINSEYFEVSDKRIVLTGRFSDNDVKKLCLYNRDKKVYFIEIDESSFILKQFYNPDFYINRTFKTFVIDRRKLEDLISYIPRKKRFSSSAYKLKELFIVSKKNEDFSINDFNAYDNVCLLNVKDAETAFNNFCANGRKAKAYWFPLKGSTCNDEDIRVHWFHVQNCEEIHWINSAGSVQGLRNRFTHFKINNEFLIKEKDLIEYLDYKKVVLIADNPGMGKSTSLSKLYESSLIAKNHWAIRIDLKEHVNEIKTIDSAHFKIKDLIRLLINIKPSLDDKLTEDLLKSILTTDTGFKKCLLAFDGFDEILDEEYRTKLVFLLKYIQKNTKSKIWITTRLHHKQQLEDELSTFALEFEPLDDERKQNFIERFFQDRLKLILKPELVRHVFYEQNPQVRTYAKKFLEHLETVFHNDVATFIGTPLQLNLMTENSTEHFKYWAESKNKNVIDFSYLGTNVLEVYEKFIDKKYEIYFRKHNVKGDFVQNREKKLSRQYHKVLAESLARNRHFDSTWHEATPLMLLIGLIQSDGTALNPQFIHFTLREFFFALVFIDHITDNSSEASTYEMNDFIDRILLLPGHHLVRNFINIGLKKFNMRELPSQNVAMFKQRFSSFWEKKEASPPESSEFMLCWRSEKILWNTVEECNENIFTFIIFSCEELMTDSLCADIITMKDDEHQTFLHKAIFNKNEQICRLLFEKIENLPLYQGKELLNIRNIDDNTILHSAVESGDLKMVKFVLEKLEELLPFDRLQLFLVAESSGKNALHKASEKGYTEIVKILIEKRRTILRSEGPKLFLVASPSDQYWATPLYKAVENGHTDTVKVLLDAERQVSLEKAKSVLRSNDQSQTLLHIAAVDGNTTILGILLREGVTSLTVVAKKNVIMKVDTNAETVLHVAVSSGNVEAVRMLLATGMSMLPLQEQRKFLMMQNKASETVLHMAAKHRSVELMSMLLRKSKGILMLEDQKTFFLVKNIRSETVLNKAVESGDTDTVKVLLDAESELVPTEKEKSILVTNDQSQTVLHTAVANGFTDIAKILLKGIEPLSLKARINIITMKDDSSSTILHAAVSNGHTAIVKLLLETTSNILPSKEQRKFFMMENGASETIFHLAAKHPDTELTRMLSEKSVQILPLEEQQILLLVRNYRLETVFHVAVSKGHTGVMKLLLEKGMKMLLREEQNIFLMTANRASDTVLHLAAKHTTVELMSMLLEKINEVLVLEEQQKFFSIRNYRSETVLHIAVTKGHTAVVKVLLETGLNMLQNSKVKRNFFEATDRASKTILHLAAKRPIVELMRLLLEKTNQILLLEEQQTFFLVKSNSSETALHTAVSNGHEGVVKALLETGLSMLLPEVRKNYFMMTTADSETVFHLAAKNSSRNLMNMLLDKSNDILFQEEQQKLFTTKNRHSETVLHVAVSRGHTEVVKEILETGLNILQDPKAKRNFFIMTNKASETILNLAAKRPSIELMTLLVEKSNQILLFEEQQTFFLVRNACAETVLHVAVASGNIEVIKQLLKTKINMLHPNVRKNYFMMTNENSETVFHLAAKHPNGELMSMLLKESNDNLLLEERRTLFLVRNNNNLETALHIAVSRGHTGVVKVLLEIGMRMLQDTKAERDYFMATNGASETVLNLAAKHPGGELVGMLLEASKNILLLEDRKEFVLKSLAEPLPSQFADLYKAVESGQIDAVKKLLDAERHIEPVEEEKKVLTLRRNQDSQTSLDIASAEGQAKSTFWRSWK